MRRRDFITLVGGAATWPIAARAQQPARLPRIGILWPNPVTASGHFVDAFRQGLGELGYVEGSNMTIEFRTAEGRMERLPDLAAELVQLPVEVILTATSPTIRAAQQATRTIPIVMGNSQDPVSEGFVASLARPGGNITGLTLFSPDIAAKRLQLVKEVAPTLTRVAILWHADDPALGLALREMRAAAQMLQLDFRSLGVRGPSDFEPAFRMAIQDGVGALVVVEDNLTFPQVRWLRAFEDLVYVGGCPPVHVSEVRTICDQAAWSNPHGSSWSSISQLLRRPALTSPRQYSPAPTR
jgi:putative tryptophan/tyrosine transport system substrate-binding protein